VKSIGNKKITSRLLKKKSRESKRQKLIPQLPLSNLFFLAFIPHTSFAGSGVLKKAPGGECKSNCVKLAFQ
jgi:hypothetical protein